MIGNRHNIPRMQSNFYRDNYYRALRWLFVSVLIMLLLVIAIIYLELFTIQPKYYASTTTGQIIELNALMH